MMKMLSALAAAGFVLASVSVAAHAKSALPIAGGCGPGFHRGIHNACMRNHVLHCVTRPSPTGPRTICS